MAWLTTPHGQPTPIQSRLGKLGDGPGNVRRAIVRDARFAGLLSLMARMTEGGGDGAASVRWRWTPKACALVLNGLSHLLQQPGDAGAQGEGACMLRRLVGFAADCLVREAEALAPRHISLGLNALARLLPLLAAEEGEGEGGDEWGLFLSVMVARCVWFV